MADATATKDYDIKIEDLAAARKRVTITVPASAIDEKIEESMGTLSTQTTLPGFRKGRAPKQLLERRFGSTVRSETRNQLVADAYATAIEEHSIKPVGEPEPVGDIEALEFEPGKPFTFAVEVEVVPEFDLPDLSGIEVKKPVIEVADEHIDAEIQRQCVQFGQLSDVGKDFQPGDRLFGPVTVTKKGEEKPFFTHDNIDITVPASDDGSGAVLGLLIDDLAKTLAGRAVGDVVTIETTGPAGHELEEVRGNDLVIAFTIRDGKHMDPATPAQVIEAYGLPSEDILREQIKLALEHRRDEEQRAAMREQVCTYLAGAVDFEVPAKLSASQAGRLLERQRLEMLYRGGLSPDEVEQRLAEMRAETEVQSRDRLKLSFILHKLADHFEVEVTDQEVNGRIAAIASQRGVRPEKLRAEMIQSGGVRQIASQIREHKAADRVIDQATVTDISAEDWNKLYAKTGETKTVAKKKT
ncbi:MAG: trigger factor, partial [Phycisphaerae bacterium]|nr:trigger factor [Phycisphaerae bacterium]